MHGAKLTLIEHATHAQKQTCCVERICFGLHPTQYTPTFRATVSCRLGKTDRAGRKRQCPYSENRCWTDVGRWPREGIAIFAFGLHQARDKVARRPRFTKLMTLLQGVQTEQTHKQADRQAGREHTSTDKSLDIIACSLTHRHDDSHIFWLV